MHAHMHRVGQLPYSGPLPVHQRKRATTKGLFSPFFFQTPQKCFLRFSSSGHTFKSCNVPRGQQTPLPPPPLPLPPLANRLEDFSHHVRSSLHTARGFIYMWIVASFKYNHILSFCSVPLKNINNTVITFSSKLNKYVTTGEVRQLNRLKVAVQG